MAGSIIDHDYWEKATTDYPDYKFIDLASLNTVLSPTNETGIDFVLSKYVHEHQKFLKEQYPMCRIIKYTE